MDRVARGAAKQLPSGFVGGFASDVPQGHVDGTDGVDEDYYLAKRKTTVDSSDNRPQPWQQLDVCGQGRRKQTYWEKQGKYMVKNMNYLK